MAPTRSSDELQAIQVVIDRVSSYQDGAPEGTVEAELRKGLTEAGVELSDAETATLADAIEAEHGSVDAGSVLG